MTQYTTRAYNSFSFNFRNSTIRKHSAEQRLAQEAEYYKQVPPHLSIYFPRLIASGFSETTGQHFLELELYPYQNLGRYLIEEKLSDAQWVEIARLLLEILSEFKATTADRSLAEDLRAMYLEKTEGEYKKLVENFKPFQSLANQRKVFINGKEYLNFADIWPDIKERFLEILLDPDIVPSVIHGDFCFSNILVGFLPDDKTILRFVDPRGMFGATAVYGDPYYDLAKLMHSTDIGYEYFIYDQFQVSQESNNRFCLTYSNSRKAAVHEIFLKELYSRYDVRRIQLIQATIYIGMCARHYDSPLRQLAMYLSGVRLLNEFIQGT